MNSLEEYLEKIDNGSFDHTDKYEIEAEFQKLRDTFSNEKNNELANKAQLEMEILDFTIQTKDYQLLLSYSFAGKRQNDKGEMVPVEWPDSSIYTEDDFDYTFKRFNDTKNDFLKSVYGFVLLLANNSKYKGDNIAIDVLMSLLALSSKYNVELKDVEDKKNFALFLHLVLEQAFILAYKRRKNDKRFLEILKSIKDLIYSIIINWNVKNKASRYMTDFVLLVENFYNEFKMFNLEIVLDKLWELSNHLITEYIHGSISVAQIGLKFSKKINLKEKYKWSLLIAQNYERLADEAQQRKDLFYVSFLEDALREYEALKDEDKIIELKERFIEAKTNFSLPSISTEIPSDIFEDARERVNEFLKDAKSLNVIDVFIRTPMISSLENLREYTEKMYSETPLIAMMSKSIIDKMGNTSAEYKHNNKEELFYSNLMFNYNLEFQVPLFEIDLIFIQAVKKKILSSNDVILFLKSSWIGETINKMYNGKTRKLNLLKIVEGQIISIFQEIEKNIEDINYEINLIQSIDSLTLKFEYLFRFLAERLGVATFRNKSKQGKKLNEEISLNTLLIDEDLVKKFKEANLEDDLFLFKYILIEKIGWNLRNDVAHGLMDSDQYSYQHGIILIVILLKIASYNFKTVAESVSE